MQRRPLVAGLAALAALLVLAAPALDLRFGMPDAGNGPTDLTSRRAYDLMTESFGPGANGPLLVAVDLDGRRHERRWAGGRRARRVRHRGDRRRAVGAAAGGERRGDAAVVTVIPTTGPQDEATEDLVHALRDDVAARPLAGTGMPRRRSAASPRRSSTTASTSASRLPLFIGGVVVLSFLLLHVGVPLAAGRAEGGGA